MNPDNPNIDDLLKTLGKKRGRKDIIIIGSKEVIVEFKILAMKQFQDSFKDKKINNRELSKLLDDYETVFSATQLFIEDNTLELEKNQKTTVILLLSVQIKLIIEIREEIKKQGRKFNIHSYLKNQIEKLESVLEKDQGKHSNKRVRLENDYESDSDAETSDEEEEDEEGDEEEDTEDNFRNYKSNLVDKVGKEFIEQLYRGKGSNELEDETLKYFCNLSNKERTHLILTTC
jgi:hypothetical protein